MLIASGREIVQADATSWDDPLASTGDHFSITVSASSGDHFSITVSYVTDAGELVASRGACHCPMLAALGRART